MKKILLYSGVAVVLGLLLILVPLITFAQTTTENGYATLRPFSKQLEGLEGLSADTPKYSTSDVKALAFSFIIASVAYLLFKRRTSRHDYRWTGLPPY